MRPVHDDSFEMSRPDFGSALEATFEEALSKARSGDNGTWLNQFVADVRLAASVVPAPTPDFAEILAHGFSTDKGNLPATAASNVHGPAEQASGLPKWRTKLMSIPQFITGLSLAGKVMLGAGAAMAATTGAGAANALPDPVQHAVSQALAEVTPFQLPDPGRTGGEHHPADPGHDADREHGPTSTARVPDPATTVRHAEPTIEPPTEQTTVPGEPPREPATGHQETGTTRPPSSGDTGGTGDRPTPTTTVTSGGSSDDHPSGSPDEHGPATTQPPSGGDEQSPTATTLHPTPPTTVVHEEHPTAETIRLSCTAGRDPQSVTCTWTHSADPSVVRYLLLRTADGSSQGRVLQNTADGTHFVDTTVTAGTTFRYMVVATRADGSTADHSNRVPVTCCGA